MLLVLAINQINAQNLLL